MTEEEIRVKALELAVSAVAAYKNSNLFAGWGISFVRTADIIAKYITSGQINPPASE